MHKESITQLDIERDESGNVFLTQDLGGQSQTVCLSPVHIRRLVELSGIAAKPTDDRHERTTRALRRLSERVFLFRENFATFADFNHAGLSDEMLGLNALSDLAIYQLEDLGHHDLVADLNSSDNCYVPTPPPEPQKPAVASFDKPVGTSKPVIASPVQESESVALVLTAISGSASGITRQELASALSGKLGRTRVYEIASALVSSGRTAEADGILSVADDGADGQSSAPDGKRTSGRTNTQTL